MPTIQLRSLRSSKAFHSGIQLTSASLQNRDNVGKDMTTPNQTCPIAVGLFHSIALGI